MERKNNYSLEVVSRLIDVSSRTICGWEHGLVLNRSNYNKLVKYFKEEM